MAGPDRLQGQSSPRHLGNRTDLHNHSVPTLHDLLLPASMRPATFRVASDAELDPAKVGLAPVSSGGFVVATPPDAKVLFFGWLTTTVDVAALAARLAALPALAGVTYELGICTHAGGRERKPQHGPRVRNGPNRA